MSDPFFMQSLGLELKSEHVIFPVSDQFLHGCNLVFHRVDLLVFRLDS